MIQKVGRKCQDRPNCRKSIVALEFKLCRSKILIVGQENPTDKKGLLQYLAWEHLLQTNGAI
jgi:hypothetical protein